MFLFDSFRDPPSETRLELSPSIPRRTSSGAERLAYWAQSAGKEDELRAALEDRKKKASETDILVIEAYLAEDDTDASNKVLAQLLNVAGMLPHVPGANEKMRVAALRMQSLEYSSPIRRQFFQRVAQSVTVTPRVVENTWLLLSLMVEATAAVENSDRPALDACLSAATRVANASHDFTRSEAHRRTTLTRLYRDAQSHASGAGRTAMALYLFARGRLTRSGKSRPAGSANDVVAVSSSTFQALFQMERQKRYELLKDLVWTLPRCSLADLSTFAPTESIPQRFVESYKQKYQVDQLPIQQVCGLGNSSLGLLEWYMRDAIALGYETELRDELKRAEEKDAADGQLARLVFAQATNSEIDISPLIEGTGDSAILLSEALKDDAVPLPIHYDIARAAIRDPATRALGIELAERLSQSGIRWTNDIALFGRHVTAQARLAREPKLGSDSLEHFVRVDDFSYRQLLRGLPRESIWLPTDDGDWEHQASAKRSSLLLKYPLTGKFKVEFECFDAPFALCSATAMGLYFDFKTYTRSLGLDVIGFRKRDSRAAGALKSQQLFTVEIKRDSGQGTVAVESNEYSLGKFRVEEEAYPFFGLHALSNQKTVLRNFRVVGQPEIPRSMQLVTPRLWGWSAAFLERKLPPLGSLTTSGARSAKSMATSGAPQSLGYDWEYDEGELRSVNHVTNFQADKAAGRSVKRRGYRDGEEWIYFGRPLCDGETVTLDFYQERGKFSLYPTIDRVAVQLSDPLREHWISSDAQLFGLSADDYFDLPANRILGEPQLQEKQWNVVSLKRSGDRVTLALNGSPVYWQKVDSTLGGRFGLFCVPEQFHVRVRQVTLTGKWPEKLPQDLFEIK
ncbi:MAG: hypothetical protein Aurels2KO_46270 [Aureliella sp.]